MDTPMPTGFTVRPPTISDAADVAALMTASSAAEGDNTGIDAAILESDWTAPGFDLSRDSWLMAALDGTAAAYANVFLDGHNVGINGGVLPRFERHGLGTALLALIEQRAHQIATESEQIETLTGAFSSTNQSARRVYEKAGFAPVRYFLTMSIQLDAPPPAPVWPEGVTVRPFEPGRDERTMYGILDEAFEDHWEHTQIPYDTWLAQKQYPGAFDFSLWLIAEADGQSAGAILPRIRGGSPWIQALGVRRQWRGHGLGLALLRQAFGEFYTRGEQEVSLMVDADSPTGATRLYEKAGMSVATRADFYRKALK